MKRHDHDLACQLYSGGGNASPLEQFQNAMADMQLVCNEQIIMDGELHRFKNGNDRKKNSWYVMYHDHGAFGCWKMGEQGTWCIRKTMTREQQRALQRQMKQDRMRRQLLREDTQQETALKADFLWEGANEARVSADHDYLFLKGVHPNGTRIKGDTLYIPMYFGNELWNLQQITPYGRKRFLKGGRTKGCSFTLSLQETKAPLIYICEGFATACSVFAAARTDTVCAFSSYNLPEVARMVADRNPFSTLVIAADNDEVGLRLGREAMEVSFAKSIVFPNEEGMDWNDFLLTHDLLTTRQELLI